MILICKRLTALVSAWKTIKKKSVVVDALSLLADSLFIVLFGVLFFYFQLKVARLLSVNFLLRFSRVASINLRVAGNGTCK